MITHAAVITLMAHEAHSLKDKRRIVKSLIDQVRHRFNVSIAEVDAQDYHQKIVIGIACVSNSDRVARSILDTVVHWIEDHSEADIVSVETVL